VERSVRCLLLGATGIFVEELREDVKNFRQFCGYRSKRRNSYGKLIESIGV
jgi:hypothetical protein